MLTITDKARAKLDEFAEQAEVDDLALRVAIIGRGAKGFQYDLQFISAADKQESDVSFELEGVNLLIDEKSVDYLAGSTLDFVESLMGGGFNFDNPNPLWLDPVAQAVQEVMLEEVNPAVAMHGGQVDLIDVKDGEAIISFGGGCQGCGMVDVTLRQGVEVMIMDKDPEITRIVDATDHAAGMNPFFTPSVA